MPQQLLMRDLAAIAVAIRATFFPLPFHVQAGAKKVHRAEIERLDAGASETRAHDDRHFVHGGDVYMDAVADLRRLDGRIGEEGLRAKNALGFAATKLRAAHPWFEGDETAHQSLGGS